MAIAASARHLHDRLDARVAQRVVPLLGAISAAFVFVTLVTALSNPTTIGLPEVLLPGGAACILGATAFAVRRDPAVLEGRANLVAGTALVFPIAASFLAMALFGAIGQMTNVLILVFAASVTLLSRAWMASLLAVAGIGWALVTLQMGAPAARLSGGLALVATSILAATIHHLRVREAGADERFTSIERENALRMERTIAAEREHARHLTTINDSLEAFTYVVSHDLKEPIRGLRFHLEELAEELDAPRAQRAETVAGALRSHAQLERLVLGLLDWSRVTSTPVEPEPLDVRAILDDAATRAIYERVFRERRVKLLVDHDIPRVLGTPALLRQALGNLILNAARHNDRPDAQVRVYAADDAPQGMVDVIVEDNGPGFPAAVIDRIRTLKDRPSTVKGGFGLAIARRAVDRLGGALHLTNREEGGAQAHVLVQRFAPEPDLAHRVRELV